MTVEASLCVARSFPTISHQNGAERNIYNIIIILCEREKEGTREGDNYIMREGKRGDERGEVSCVQE